MTSVAETPRFWLRGCQYRELKQETFLSQGRPPEVKLKFKHATMDDFPVDIRRIKLEI